MIEIVKEKIKENNISNMYCLNFDLTKEQFTQEKFDVIYTSSYIRYRENN